MSSSSFSPLRIFIVAVVAVAAFFAGRLSRPSSTADRSAVTPPVVRPDAATGANGAGRATVVTAPEAGAGVRADFAVRAARAPESLASDDERQKTIEQWAEHDPLAAIEFARGQLKGDRRAQAMSAVLAIWGKNDPAAAWTWVKNNEPAATHHFDTLLEVFGKTSPVTAARFANEFVQTHPEAALEVNLAALLGITYSGDFTAARAFVDGNLTLAPDVRANLNNFIAGQWARYAPEAAAAWTLALPAGPQRDQALVGLGESWAEADPVGAAKFATALPAGETRQLALRQAITHWLETDPEQARRWVLETNHHDDYDQAVAAVATQNNFMFREPDRALHWAATIFDDTIRVQSTATILAGLYERDPTTTVAYIRSAPDLSEEQRRHLLEQFPPKP